MNLSTVRFPYHIFPEVEIHGVLTLHFKGHWCMLPCCIDSTPELWKVPFIAPLPALAISDFFGKEGECDRSLTCQDMCRY